MQSNSVWFPLPFSSIFIFTAGMILLFLMGNYDFSILSDVVHATGFILLGLSTGLFIRFGVRTIYRMKARPKQS